MGTAAATGYVLGSGDPAIARFDSQASGNRVGLPRHAQPSGVGRLAGVLEGGRPPRFRGGDRHGR